MQQKGFSLIELLVVLAIIGLLSTIAVPGYKNHLLKAHVSELLLMAQPVKLAISEALLDTQALAAINNDTLNLPAIENQKKIRRMGVENGIITIEADARKIGLNSEADAHIHLTPHYDEASMIVSWTCSSTHTALQKALPGACRE